ncbi:hypothetical protein PHSY_001078 [Pseudozyma hubeiensis SY62]|uniref:Uncharacterized protein n=1 Tax=Pseudozyma hubeiensis (strain SY62) TaxID=1305764 RepID=R9NXQ0_PSEHS|nr:hypothetical protein PHSY_001078 [Pseudozyma hubeiensis SY62]GAC93513.1 hypothetical protein PHSY_001078 [Pseudozyma hubeiensis SY62]
MYCVRRNGDTRDPKLLYKTHRRSSFMLPACQQEPFMPNRRQADIDVRLLVESRRQVRTGGTTSVTFHAVFALNLLVDVGVFQSQRMTRQREPQSRSGLLQSRTKETRRQVIPGAQLPPMTSQQPSGSADSHVTSSTDDRQ